MAGLLGDSWEDPKSTAVLALAGGLLGPGGFGTALQRGLIGYQGSLASDAELKFKKAQTDAMAQEAALRDFNVQRMKAQLAEALSWNQQQGHASSPQFQTGVSALGQGAAQGNVGPTVQNAQAMDAMPAPAPLPPGVARYQGMPLEQLRARMNIGLEPKEAVELWKAANIGTQMNPGWRITGNQPPQYLPDPTKGITMSPDSKTVMPMPGAANTLGTLAGATAEGDIRAKNRNTPIPVDRLDRMPGVSPYASLDDLLNPNPGAVAATPNRNMATSITADMRQTGAPPSMTVNGAPVQPTFKTAADIAQETKRGTNIEDVDKAYAEELNKRVNEGFNMKRRNAEILEQLKDYSTGIGGAEGRTKIASNLINLFPDNPLMQALAEKVNGGSVVSAQTLNNLVAGAMVTNAIQVLQGNGRLNKAEIMQMQKSAESAGTDPHAFERIISIQNKYVDQDYAEQQARAAAMKSKTYVPETWQADWAKQQFEGMKKPTGLFAPATPAATAGVAAPLPANLTSSNLVLGKTYRLPNGETAKWDGFKFRSQ